MLFLVLGQNAYNGDGFLNQIKELKGRPMQLDCGKLVFSVHTMMIELSTEVCVFRSDVAALVKD
jgi:hypothetical protein